MLKNKDTKWTKKLKLSFKSSLTKKKKLSPKGKTKINYDKVS